MDESWEAQWRTRMDGILRELADWRLQHPDATLTDLEQRVDARMAAARAQLLADLAQATDPPPVPPPTCPSCQIPLQRRGQRRRTLRTHGDQALPLDRTYLVCPHCGQGVFPPG